MRCSNEDAFVSNNFIKTSDILVITEFQDFYSNGGGKNLKWVFEYSKTICKGYGMADNTSENYLALHQILQHHGMKAEGTVLTEDERALALQLVVDNKLMFPRDEPNEPIIHESLSS